LSNSSDFLLDYYHVEEMEKLYRDMFASHLKCSTGYYPDALVLSMIPKAYVKYYV